MVVKWFAQLAWADTHTQNRTTIVVDHDVATIIMNIIKILIVTSLIISTRLSDLLSDNAMHTSSISSSLSSKRKQQVLSSRETIGRREASPQGRGGTQMGSTPFW